jgi:hypothetical protein
MYYAKDLLALVKKANNGDAVWSYSTDKILINVAEHGTSNEMDCVYGFEMLNVCFTHKNNARNVDVGTINLLAETSEVCSATHINLLDWKYLSNVLEEKAFEHTLVRVNGYRIESAEAVVRHDGRLLAIDLIIDTL